MGGWSSLQNTYARDYLKLQYEKNGQGEVSVRIRRIPRIICCIASLTGLGRDAWRSRRQ